MSVELQALHRCLTRLLIHRRWQAEVDAMYARMQTPEFAAAAREMLDEPLRVRVPEHLRRDQKG